MKYLWMLSLALIASSVLADKNPDEQGVAPGGPGKAVAEDDRDAGVPAEAKGRPIQLRPIRCYAWAHNEAIELRTSAAGVSDDLKAVWAKQIDFSNESLIRVSAGRRNSTGYGISITRVELIDNCYYVTIAMSAPKARQIVGYAMTTPTAAVVIPKAAAGATIKFVNPPNSRKGHPWIGPATRVFKVSPQGRD